MATQTFFPATNSDDGHWIPGEDFWNANWVAVGRDTNPFGFFTRFPNIALPRGATVISCRLVLQPYTGESGGPVNATIQFSASDAAVAPTSTSQADALALTEAVSWNAIQATAVGTPYESPELAGLLQAIIDRPGWTSGNAAMVVVKNNGSAGFRNTRAYDIGSNYTGLRVSWMSAEVSADTIGIADQTVSVRLGLVPADAVAVSGPAEAVSRALVPEGAVTAASPAPAVGPARVLRDIACRRLLPVGRDLAAGLLAPGVARDVVCRREQATLLCRDTACRLAVPFVLVRDAACRHAFLDHDPVSRDVACRAAVPDISGAVMRTFP